MSLPKSGVQDISTGCEEDKIFIALVGGVPNGAFGKRGGFTGAEHKA